MVSIVPRLLTSCRMTGTPPTVRPLKVPALPRSIRSALPVTRLTLCRARIAVGFPGRHQHMVGIVGQQVDDPTHVGGSAHALTLVVEQDHDVAGLTFTAKARRVAYSTPAVVKLDPACDRRAVLPRMITPTRSRSSLPQ
jgi:hypothetical protein